MKKSFGIWLVFVSCSSYAQHVNKILPPMEFKSKMEATKGAIILDVRTQEEVSKGIITGATNIDFNSTDFEKEISTLDKSKSYFVYCGAGIRSTKAAKQMEKAGFEKVYNLEGGYKAWKELKLKTTIP